jgi:hypothetical protein
MHNPWRDLSFKRPYVLLEDHAAIEEANKKNDNWEFQYHLELLPDPYIGNLEAPVVLFSLNPGYTRAKQGDANCNDDWWHANSQDLHDAYRRNFREERSLYPMFFLDPIFANNPGGRYWNKKLGDLIALCGREKVAKALLTIEFFPYHSHKFRGGCHVPSQKFALYQIQRAMERKATIILVRATSVATQDVPPVAG